MQTRLDVELSSRGTPGVFRRVSRFADSRSAVRIDRKSGRRLTGTPGVDRESPEALPVPMHEGATVCRKYGTWVLKKMYGREFKGVQRATFLIGVDGKIERVWPKVTVGGHVGDVVRSGAALR